MSKCLHVLLCFTNVVKNGKNVTETGLLGRHYSCISIREWKMKVKCRGCDVTIYLPASHWPGIIGCHKDHITCSPQDGGDLVRLVAHGPSLSASVISVWSPTVTSFLSPACLLSLPCILLWPSRTALKILWPQYVYTPPLRFLRWQSQHCSIVN